MVAYQRPEDVEAAAGEGEDRLLVALAFVSFAVVEGLRGGAEPGGDLGGEVEDA